MTVLEKIKKRKIVAKQYDIDAAAAHLGVKPWTVRKWFRTYDINGYKGKTPDMITDTTLLWLVEHLREVDAGGRKFIALSGVRRVINKHGQSIVRAPDLGFWTPRPAEIRRYLRRLPKEIKEDTQKFIEEGYLPISLIAARLGVSGDTIRHGIAKAKAKPHVVLANRFAFYDPVAALDEVVGLKGKPGPKPSARARVKPDDRQLPLFGPDGKVAGSVQAPCVLPAPPASVFDDPVTASEIKKSLVKVPGETAKLMVEALVKAGKYMTAQVSSARLGVHRTTIHTWFRENDKRKKGVMKFGRISLYPVALLKEYEDGVKAKAQEKIKKAEKARVGHSGGSVGELAKALSRAIRGYKISEGERKLLVEFGRLMMLDMLVDP